jgi:hypothetical protein
MSICFEHTMACATALGILVALPALAAFCAPACSGDQLEV